MVRFCRKYRENVKNIYVHLIYSFRLKKGLVFFSSVQMCIGNFAKRISVEKAVSNRQEMASSWVKTVTAKDQKVKAKF